MVTPNKLPLSTERISQRVLYALVAVIAVVFALFFLVGFDTPFAANPSFNAPLFTSALIVLMWGMLGVATLAAVVTLIKKARYSSQSEKMVNGIPTRRISLMVSLGTMLCLGLTLLLGSSAQMLINGVPFTDPFWLKTADMLVNTSLIMLLTAALAVAFGATRYHRKRKKN
ncbi:hypothetical protein [Prevotella ihumii]|uniref:hypothetical protein n=1 Tax=Prevotella ihumii TaxID=1917878 RepID=UPI0009813612|nr:hypothetical protein [Prevotella ihumii]